MASGLGTVQAKMAVYYKELVRYAWRALSELILNDNNLGVPRVPLEEQPLLSIDNNKNKSMTATKEVWNFDNAHESLRTAEVYEAALTIFIFGQDPSAQSHDLVSLGLDDVDPEQFDAARSLFSESTLKASHYKKSLRRYEILGFMATRVAGLPDVEKMNVVDENNVKKIRFVEMPLICGRAIALGYYSAIADAHKAGDKLRMKTTRGWFVYHRQNAHRSVA